MTAGRVTVVVAGREPWTTAGVPCHAGNDLNREQRKRSIESVGNSLGDRRGHARAGVDKRRQTEGREDHGVCYVDDRIIGALVVLSTVSGFNSKKKEVVFLIITAIANPVTYATSRRYEW